MEKELKYGLMGANMKVNGREIKCVVLVNFIIPMEIITKELSYKIRHTDKEAC